MEQQLQSMPDRRWILLSTEIFTHPYFRERVRRILLKFSLPLRLCERVRRAMDFVLWQGKILPVEGVYIAVLDRHRAIF